MPLPQPRLTSRPSRGENFVATYTRPREYAATALCRHVATFPHVATILP
jgi:hypothetical protein